MTMDSPFLETPALEPEAHRDFLRRAMFECCKWDPQVGDVAVLAPFPVALAPGVWPELAAMAEKLAAEAIAAEAELLDRPDLWSLLALPRAVRNALDPRRGPPTPGPARVFRFDFHPTPEGWRISEANSDAPGGYNEASGVARLMVEFFPSLKACGDPASALADAALRAAGPRGRCAMAHATAYSDDRQVVEFLAARFLERGLEPLVVSPAHIRWNGGAASVETDWARSGLDLIFRFFPAEWLPNLRRETEWGAFFRGGRTPVINPGASILTQTKRFPLAWDRMRTPLASWSSLLPETLDPREVSGANADSWVFKPAFGRVGEDVGIAGVTDAVELAKIRKAAARRPGEWAAQRRFQSLPFRAGGRVFYPCLGVYTVDGRAAGAYGRLPLRPLTDSRSLEAAVLEAR